MSGRALLLFAALAVSGCSLAARHDCDDDHCGPSARVDGGVGGTDAAVADGRDGGAAAGTDASSPPAGFEGRDDAAQCFDGRDNDLVGGVDCEDSGCAALPICCVGVTSAACCTAPLPTLELGELGGCAGSPASSCAALAGATVFGSPEPFVDATGALVPNGGDVSDSGLVLPGEVRPQVARVVVRARIAAPRACEGCVDAVAISLAPEGAIGPGVRGVTGLLVSGSRGDVSLLVGGAVAWTQPLPDDAEHEYELTVDPHGVVSLRSDTPSIAAATVAAALPDTALRVVVHGRTSNRGGTSEPPARLRSLEVTSTGCDVPDALTRGESPLASPVVSPWPEGSERAPSIARPDAGGDDTTRLAFAADGAIWMARPDGAGGFTIEGTTPALRDVPSAPGGLRDPELVALADRWLLFFTAVDAQGRRHVARVEGGADWGETFDPAGVRALVTLPLDDPEGDVVELDGPSAIRVGGEVYVVARAIRESGATAIVLLRAAAEAAADGEFGFDEVCGTGCESLDAAATLALHGPRTDEPAAFDHDEVAAPALLRHDGVYRLYYAGRRGTRWAIGLLVSLDLGLFREGNEGAPVLAATGEGADALGVLDPEPWAHAGSLELLHTASDGVRTSIGRAAQPLISR